MTTLSATGDLELRLQRLDALDATLCRLDGRGLAHALYQLRERLNWCDLTPADQAERTPAAANSPAPGGLGGGDTAPDHR